MELYGDCVECSGERQCFDSCASLFLQVSQMSLEVVQPSALEPSCKRILLMLFILAMIWAVLV